MNLKLCHINDHKKWFNHTSFRRNWLFSFLHASGRLTVTSALKSALLTIQRIRLYKETISNQNAAFLTFSCLVNENHKTSKKRSLSLKIRHV